MAAIFLFVFVLVTIPIPRIFGFDCTGADYEKIMNCDQCIKCGGLWCINPKENEYHCALSRQDDGCKTDDRDIYPSFPKNTGENNTLPINPYYAEDSIKVRGEKNTVNFITPNIQVDFSDIQHTGSSLPTVDMQQKCRKDKCERKFVVKLDENFCSDTGGPVQHFNISLKIKKVELATMRYRVACACECSKNVSVNDEYCSGRGNLSCGVCACNDRWEGKNCEQEKPYDETEYVEPPNTGECDKRGDANCIHDLRPDVECSGNGKCGDCCVCDRTKSGWQYFIREKYCEDLCMTTAELLRAGMNSSSIHLIDYNENVTSQLDSKGRNIWVKCNETIEEYVWEYYARKNIRGEIGVMILKKNSPEAAAIESGGVNVTALVVPLVVAAALAMAATAYYVFKGQGMAPQPSRANYQGLDGPKTRVETNPVYIEPIKSYKNPTYVQNK